MLCLMSDAFSTAVEDARARLAQTEGRTISIRELARRAGIPESTLNYHLSPKRAAEGRRVPGAIVQKLEDVLPVAKGHLMRAAQVAAGYEVRENGDELPDLRHTIVRYLGEAPSQQARMEVLAELQRIMADEMRRVAAEQPTTPEAANGE